MQQHFSWGRSVLAAGLAAALVACGGGGGGGDSKDSTPPVVTMTSHQDNDVITGGNRVVTVTWTVSDDVGVAASGYTLNGGSAVAVTGSGGIYSTDISFGNNANTLVVSATDAAGNLGTQTLNLDYPFAQLSDGQAAAVVIGQSDFDASAPDLTASTLANPYGSPAIHEGKLLISDPDNNRILGFNTIPTANGAEANFVWGQLDFTSAVSGFSSDGLAADRLNAPRSLVASDGRLFVMDGNNRRILIWNTLPTATSGYITPDVIVGQPNATDTTSACDRSSFDGETFFVVGSKLIVADSWRHRVLIWNTIPTENGTNADLVLGQADFTSCASNRGSTPDANTMADPFGIWSDGQRLYVAEWNNNRVLIWDTFPTQDGQAADHVLGQSDMQSNTSGAAARDTLSSPYMMGSNGNQLFLVDSGNCRVLVWDSLPATDGALPDHVLGQADFDTNSCSTGAASFGWPSGVVAYGNQLVVNDNGANRVLVFNGQ